MEDTREVMSGPDAPAQATQPWTFSKSSLIRKLRQHLTSCKYIHFFVIYAMYLLFIFIIFYKCIYAPLYVKVSLVIPLYVSLVSKMHC